CSVTLNRVLLGGLVLSVHEETGMGALPSVLLDARSGLEIPLSDYGDRLEGFDPANRSVFVTVRNVRGRLIRTEEQVDDAFRKRWLQEREPRPRAQFAYCVVSGVPVPAALCPPEG